MSTSNTKSSEEFAAEQPLIQFSDSAKQRILQVMAGKANEGQRLRVSISGRGAGGFQYGMSFEAPDAAQPDDITFDAGHFSVVVDPESAGHLRGASVDYELAAGGGGFQIDNPNPAWDDPRAETIQELIDTQINPAVAGHGGFVQLVDVKDNIVYVQLGGGCQGCGMVDVTLRQGIEVMIREALPEIEQVVDTTDHAGGTNPYYQPRKK